MRRTGRFSGRFGKPRTATFAFEFQSSDLYDLDIRRSGEKAGKRGSVPPMDMGIPVGRTPPVKRLPGTLLGKRTSDDAVFPVCAIRNSGSTHLAAFPRTPYNRIILPLMGLRARVERDGRVDETELARTLDPDLGYHYASAVENLQPDDEIRLSVETPPQVARHDGYETAFFEIRPMRFTVPDSFSA